MITLTARCPSCEETFSAVIQPNLPLVCGHCAKTLVEHLPDLNNHALPAQCLTCPSTELFVRKDFPQGLGVTIVVAGFIGSTIAWYNHQVIWSYGILFASALVDVVLYLLMGNVVECYRCHAQYRGLTPREDQQGFQLEIHERYRQQAARLKERSVGGSSG